VWKEILDVLKVQEPRIRDLVKAEIGVSSLYIRELQCILKLEEISPAKTSYTSSAFWVRRPRRYCALKCTVASL